MINEALFKAWLKNLRSGKYKQGKGYLNGPKGFCCLGVLCDTKDPTRWTSDKFKAWDFDNITLSPTDLNAEVGIGGLVYDLAAMNDDGTPFDVIADWIEEHVQNA